MKPFLHFFFCTAATTTTNNSNSSNCRNTFFAAVWFLCLCLLFLLPFVIFCSIRCSSYFILFFLHGVKCLSKTAHQLETFIIEAGGIYSLWCACLCYAKKTEANYEWYVEIINKLDSLINIALTECATCWCRFADMFSCISSPRWCFFFFFFLWWVIYDLPK